MNQGEKVIAMEALAATTVRVLDGFIRSSTLGSNRFSPERFLSITISYAMLGATAAISDSLGDVAAAIGGLTLLIILLQAVPTGQGQNLGQEVGNAFSNVATPQSAPSTTTV